MQQGECDSGGEGDDIEPDSDGPSSEEDEDGPAGSEMDTDTVSVVTGP